MFSQFCPVKSVREKGNSGEVPIPAGVCPISGKNSTETTSQSIVTPSSEPAECPIKHDKSMSSGGECPIQSDGKTEFIYNTKANDLEYNQLPQPGQTVKLSTTRVVSNIPKSDVTPEHQKGAEDKNNWVFPSQQQIYNAMKRKGYNPPEVDVPAILQIHNTVNEKGWSQVQEWERLRGFQNSKLKTLRGRPTDTSPKAWFLTHILGYEPPFDRHDWTVIRENKEEVRYVIDFYKGNTFKKGSPLAMYLDVRPAMDSIPAVMDRLSYEWRMNFSPYSLPRSSVTSSGKPKYSGLVANSKQSEK